MKIKLSVKDYIFAVIVAVALVLGIIQLIGDKNKQAEMNSEKARVVVGESVLSVFVADTEEERYQGLSGVEKMEAGQGILFVHESPGRHAYVMRGMLFDLDFVFILGDQVVDIAKNVAREYKGEIRGAADYDKVLEVNAEWARFNNVKIGQHVSIE